MLSAREAYLGATGAGTGRGTAPRPRAHSRPAAVRQAGAELGAVADAATRGVAAAGAVVVITETRPPARENAWGVAWQRGWSVVWSVVAALWAACCRLVARWSRQQRARQGSSARSVIIGQLQMAMRGSPCLSEGTVAAVGGEEVARAIASSRAARADRTDAKSLGALRSLCDFVSANPRLAEQRLEPGSSPAADVWDAVVEAWVVAQIRPEGAPPFTRPSGWAANPKPRSVRSAVGCLTSALQRLGYQEGLWPMTRAQLTACGAGDIEDTTHARPVWAWQVFAGLRALGPRLSPWLECAAAMTSLGAVGGRRVGNIVALLRENLRQVDTDEFLVSYVSRQKQQHQRATRRPRMQCRPVLLRHWALRVWLAPWLQRLEEWRVPGTCLAFPSMVRLGVGGRRVTTQHGFDVEGFHVEMARPWSWRQQAMALGTIVLGPGNLLGFQGLRVAHTSELKRYRSEVTDVVRRTIQGRSVRDLIGAEDAYTEVYADDMSAATARIGGVRVTDTDGLCRVCATSASAGELDDWVPTSTTAAVDLASESSSDDEADGQARPCSRCQRQLRPSDISFSCAADGCDVVSCPTCHPNGSRQQFRCQEHRYPPRVHSRRGL